MFEGVYVGRKDSNGKRIKCGDRVSYYEFQEAYLQTHSEDGWGRTRRLCKHEQYIVPCEKKTTNGTVVYNQEHTEFQILFDDYLLNSGNKEMPLRMCLYDTNKLIIIDGKL